MTPSSTRRIEREKARDAVMSAKQKGQATGKGAGSLTEARDQSQARKNAAEKSTGKTTEAGSSAEPEPGT